MEIPIINAFLILMLILCSEGHPTNSENSRKDNLANAPRDNSTRYELRSFSGCAGIKIDHGNLWNGKQFYHINEPETVICDTAYTLKGGESIVCTDQGWKSKTKEFPACHLTCPPWPLKYGKCKGPVQAIDGDCLDCQCDGDYKLDGAKRICCGSYSVWEVDNVSIWNVSQTDWPGCMKKQDIKTNDPTCPGNVIDNGNLWLGKQVYLIGERDTVICETAYRLVGSEDIKCTYEGWTSYHTGKAFPSCNLTCPPWPLKYGKCKGPVQAIDGECLDCQCDDGYELDGAKTICCGSYSVWEVDNVSVWIVNQTDWPGCTKKQEIKTKASSEHFRTIAIVCGVLTAIFFIAFIALCVYAFCPWIRNNSYIRADRNFTDNACNPERSLQEDAHQASDTDKESMPTWQRDKSDQLQNTGEELPLQNAETVDLHPQLPRPASFYNDYNLER